MSNITNINTKSTATNLQPEPDPDQVAAKLRQAVLFMAKMREGAAKKGITIEQLAEICGVSTIYLNAVEDGRFSLEKFIPSVLRQISDITEIPLVELMLFTGMLTQNDISVAKGAGLFDTPF